MDHISVDAQLHAICSKEIWQIKKRNANVIFPPGEIIPFPFIFFHQRLFLKNNNKKFIFSLVYILFLMACLALNTRWIFVPRENCNEACLLVIAPRKDPSTVEYWHPEIPQDFVNRQQRPDFPKLTQIFSGGKRHNAMDMQTVEGLFNHWHDIITLTHEWPFLS